MRARPRAKGIGKADESNLQTKKEREGSALPTPEKGGLGFQWKRLRMNFAESCWRGAEGRIVPDLLWKFP